MIYWATVSAILALGGLFVWFFVRHKLKSGDFDVYRRALKAMEDDVEFKDLDKDVQALLLDQFEEQLGTGDSPQVRSRMQALITRNIKRWEKRESAGFKVAGMVSRNVAIGGATIAVLFVLMASVAIIEPGTVGVEVLFGVAQDEPLTEGFNLINPFSRVKRMNIRTQAYTMSSRYGEGRVKGDDSTGALSKDGLNMKMDITVAYRLVSQDAAVLYRCFGAKYEDEIIRPASRSANQEAVSEFKAEDAFARKRQQLALRMAALTKKHVQALLRDRPELKNRVGLRIVRVMLRRIVLPDKIKNAIKDKLAADQEAQRMEFVLAKEKKEAERKKIEATGIQKFQEIVRRGIDAQLLQWKGIEVTERLAASPNSKVVIIGGKDGLPYILNTGK